MNDPAEVQDALVTVARYATQDPAYLAWALAEYQRIEGVDDVRLVKLLKMRDPARLSGLRLCLRPRDDRLPRDVDAIAAAYGVDADALVDVIRTVDALRAMGAAPPGTVAGRLLAARSRTPGKDDTSANPKSKKRHRKHGGDK